MPRTSRTTPPVALDWRPLNYWDHPDPVSAILVNVKGEVRRTLLRAALEGKAPEFPADHMMQEELTDEERRAWGLWDPKCMGGEYLPGYLPGEVEIARVVYASMLSDVISIRARRAGGRIRYRVVDEYPESHTFRFFPRSSSRPLTLRTLMRLIWNLRIEEQDPAEGFLQTCLDFSIESWRSPEEMAAFISLESLIYRDLDRLGAERLSDWSRERWAREHPRNPADEVEDEGDGADAESAA